MSAPFRGIRPSTRPGAVHGTVLAEQHDDWIEGRPLPRTRRLGPPRMTLINTAEDTKEAITSDTTGAISA